MDQGHWETSDHVDTPACIQTLLETLFFEDPLQTMPIVLVEVFVALRSVQLHAALDCVQWVADGLRDQERERACAKSGHELVGKTAFVTFLKDLVITIKKVREAFERAHQDYCVRHLCY